jgi:hypothetical protein
MKEPSKALDAIQHTREADKDGKHVKIGKR